MKVHELSSLLEGCDPDAEVYTMAQPTYPFECAFDGVAQRGDWVPELQADEEDEPPTHAEEKKPRASYDRWSAHEADLPRNDVFLLQGQQLRYGTTRAWNER